MVMEDLEEGMGVGIGNGVAHTGETGGGMGEMNSRDLNNLFIAKEAWVRPILAQSFPPAILVCRYHIIRFSLLNHRMPEVTSNPHPACRQGMEEGIQET